MTELPTGNDNSRAALHARLELCVAPTRPSEAPPAFVRLDTDTNLTGPLPISNTDRSMLALTKAMRQVGTLGDDTLVAVLADSAIPLADVFRGIHDITHPGQAEPSIAYIQTDQDRAYDYAHGTHQSLAEPERAEADRLSSAVPGFSNIVIVDQFTTTGHSIKMGAHIVENAVQGAGRPKIYGFCGRYWGDIDDPRLFPPGLRGTIDYEHVTVPAIAPEMRALGQKIGQMLLPEAA